MRRMQTVSVKEVFCRIWRCLSVGVCAGGAAEAEVDSVIDGVRKKGRAFCIFKRWTECGNVLVTVRVRLGRRKLRMRYCVAKSVQRWWRGCFFKTCMRLIDWLNSFFRHISVLGFCAKLVVKTCVKTAMVYSWETWAVRREDEGIWQRAVIAMERLMCGVSWMKHHTFLIYDMTQPLIKGFWKSTHAASTAYLQLSSIGQSFIYSSIWVPVVS